MTCPPHCLSVSDLIYNALMNEPASTAPALGNDTGATAALAGYDYQLDVSILAALRILFVTKSATRITLEPANAEDIEVELDDDDPGHVQTQAQLGVATRLIMQVKLRGGDPWSLAAFERLLKHGKRRSPAKDHLADPDTRYILVTNADVSREARSLLVEDFEESTGKDDFPASLRKTLPDAPEGRVAIYAGLSPKLLEYEIKHILTEILRVPKDRQGPCLTALRDEAKVRMRGTTPGVWAYNDLLGTIRSHGGFLASVAELDAFVAPTNFPDMIRQLEKKNVVVIAGSSGTGKTLAARALCDQARKRNGSLDIVVVNPNSDPSSIRQIVQTGPKLFYLEDPWGQNSLRTGSETWTEQLPRMLRDAHPENQYVVTSRSDMLLGAQAVVGLAPWSIELESDRYLNGRFGKIYDKRMDLLPPDLQSKVLSFRPDVLYALEKPLELDLFFANILSGRGEGENDGEWLRRLIGLAHRDAVEGVVDRFLSNVDKTGQSAVIWGVLAARGSFDRMQLIALMRTLRTSAPDLAVGLDKLVDTMIAARHLRQPTSSVAFAHPSVRAGFEKHLHEDWFRYETAFAAVLIALTTLPQPHANWGMETAARLIDEARRLVADVEGGAINFDVPAAAHAAIDGWLEASLLDPDTDFPKLLQLASDVGSPTSNPSELARWLLTNVKRGAAFFIDRWKAPTFPEEWYERISRDARSFPIAERFVRDQLSNEHGSYGAGFAAELDRIATGLEGAYLQAAHCLVGRGYVSNAEAVIAGALRDLPAFKAVFEAALEDLARDDATRMKNTERWRAIDDGECDYGIKEYFTSGNDEEGYSSGVIVEHYVEAVRAVGDWKALAGHNHASEFCYQWARAIQDADTGAPPSFEEMAAMFVAAKLGGREKDAWDAVCHHWHPYFREPLKQALTAGIPDQSDSRAAMACAMSVDRTLLAEAFTASPTAALRIAFLCDLIGTRRRYSRIQKAGLPSLLQTLEVPFREIGWALLRGASRSAPLSRQSIEVLGQAANTVPARILSEIMPLLIRAGEAPAELIRRWLTDTTDKDLAEAAASAAAEIGDEAAIALALRHPRADARVIALQYLAGRADSPFPAELLALAADPGCRVRRALVRALAAKPHPDHLSVLLRLTGDTWSDADPSHNEPDSFPIARDAVEALAAYEPLSSRICDQLIKLATATPDRALSQECLQVAAGRGSPAIRMKIRAIIGDRESGWLRLDALNALALADTIEPELLAPFTAERIMKLGPALATSAIVLVCRHAMLDDAVALCERMGHSNEKRSLAVLGAYVLHDREPAASDAILDLLPHGHPARRLFDVEEGHLPASALDGLGGIKLQQWVQRWLSDRIAKA
ncbi:DEAD/DEAH box helicase family protein [Methylobacterium sp. E-045]|uniref:DEAD/DEAH box helicase family protein n=1 Tax=Methylobacterium sp. E-045 TaxID=2836575 RepID=UPI001FB8D953|nr:DEAD/DEAH box helicase family protein [Methylobacterium sp. E-045]MCJ2131427.1 hypothetical protein [Methylobacterium sp. E-045]